MNAVLATWNECSAHSGPAGRLKTYTECTALPALARVRLPRLYEARSRVRNAFTSMGRVLEAKIAAVVADNADAILKLGDALVRLIDWLSKTIEKVVALAVLMPIVASMGGIAGSQTLVLIIRGLALGQVEHANARWLLLREVAVGLLNGALLATLVALAAGVWFGNWMVGGIVFAALMINLLAAALAGVGVPLLLKRLGIDPALAGSVVLTTVTDTVGFAALLGLGTIFLV